MTNDQKFYLKQLAAKQFPGSIENLSTRKPVFLLQERTRTDTYSVSIYDVGTDTEDVMFEMPDNDVSAQSVSELVKIYYDAAEMSDEEARAAYKDNEHDFPVPFFSFDNFDSRDELNDWLRKNDPENEDLPVYDVADYLSVYEIAPDDVQAYREIFEWQTLAVSFCKSELEKVKESLSYHIHGETRIFGMAGSSYGRTTGDYYPLYDFLYTTGEELLAEDARNYSFTVNNVISEEECFESFRNTNGKSLIKAGEITVFCPADGYTYTLTVKLQGAMMVNHRGVEYPWCVKRMVEITATDSDGNIIRKGECNYPFECDGTGKSIREDSGKGLLTNVQRLFFYALYS